MDSLAYQLLVALGLGLLGFVEPCSIGAHLLFFGHIEGEKRASQLRQVAIFAGTRALFFGALGALTVWLGQSFGILQRGGWLVLGSLYATLGVLYLAGKASLLMRSFGPTLARWPADRASILLGFVFGLNVPACAAPLLLAVLTTAAIGGAQSAAAIGGFATLAVFGLALSAPLVLIVIWPTGRRYLDWAFTRGWSRPAVIGAVLLALGLWSIYFGLFVSPT